MIGFRGASRYAHPLYADGFALECEALRRVRQDMGLTNLKVMVPFCRRVDEALAGRSYEIILVDDCSDDGSWALLRELAGAQPRLRAQRLAARSGRVGNATHNRAEIGRASNSILGLCF